MSVLGEAIRGGPAAPSGLPGVQARLEALVDWERAPRGAMRVDLDPQRDLLARLGDPHRGLRIVHVTGTKGKGSVCALLEAGLLRAGLRAGRYASPHLEEVTERICHGGCPVPLAVFEAAAARALDARDAACREGSAGGRSTWFDVLTAAAFASFAAAGLEWAVVEVGMGGLLDSTNVVDPELAVITNVGLEHADVLGPSLESIATHKAGIIKPGRPVITPIGACEPAGRVIAGRARAVGAPLVAAAGLQGLGIRAQNLALARGALAVLGGQGHVSPVRGQPLGAADLPDALAGQVRLPGRMESFRLRAADHGRSIPVVLDGAHVGFALSGVLRELEPLVRRHGPPVVVLALAPDKDAGEMTACLAGRSARVVCTGLPGGRPCQPAQALARWVARQGGEAVACADPGRALALALDLVQDSGWLLATGSLHLAGLLRPELLARQARAMAQARPGAQARTAAP